MFFIIAIIFLIAISLQNGIEGDWVDIETGDHFVIERRDAVWSVRSADATFSLTVRGNRVVAMGDAGIYEHRGRIKWNEHHEWARHRHSKHRSFWNWVSFRNFIRPPIFDGKWIGELKNSNKIMLDITNINNNISGTVQMGTVKEPVTGLLHNKTSELITPLDRLYWAFDDDHTSTIRVNNEYVTLYKLD